MRTVKASFVQARLLGATGEHTDDAVVRAWDGLGNGWGLHQMGMLSRHGPPLHF